MKTCLVLVTCKNLSEARKIARSLLKERLVACANILPGVESHYRWQGKVEASKEVLLMAKTKAVLARRVGKRILQLHSYECPGVEVLDLQQMNADFIRWIEKETC